MIIDRRTCFKRVLGLGAAGLIGRAQQALGTPDFAGHKDRYGVLVDLTVCVGCRKCEWACNRANRLSDRSDDEYEDKSVFEQTRRTRADAYTVVNRFENSRDSSNPVFVKQQCMHCDEPACASACLVKAFTKSPEGPVVYDPSLCMGCRYCMAACPFNMPAYQYDDPWTPEVTKCSLCIDRIRQGERPACVDVCPVEALTFGRRQDLLKMAHDRIREHPDKYIDHVYGENEVGGTSWLYLSSVPFEELGFRTDLGSEPIPKKSRGFLSMVSVVLVTWPAMCLAFFTLSRRREVTAEGDAVGAAETRGMSTEAAS